MSKHVVENKLRRKRTTRASHRDACPLCREYCIPNETTRRAIVETEGSLTFADAKSAFAFLMEKGVNNV